MLSAHLCWAACPSELIKTAFVDKVDTNGSIKCIHAEKEMQIQWNLLLKRPPEK